MGGSCAFSSNKSTGEGLESKQNLVQILFPGTKFVPLKIFSFKITRQKTTQHLQKREIAEVSDLSVFEYLQNSDGSDDLIKKMPGTER